MKRLISVAAVAVLPLAAATAAKADTSSATTVVIRTDPQRWQGRGLSNAGEKSWR